MNDITVALARSLQREQDAERRRDALKKFLQQRSLTGVEAAAVCGISASTVSNFLNDRTQSLNLATLEPLAKAFGFPLTNLIGLPALPIRAYARYGEWRDTFCSPPKDGRMRQGRRRYDANTYVVCLDSDEMGLVFPAGTELEVVDLENFDGKLKVGNKVIVVRNNAQHQIENSCREITDIGSHECTLRMRSPDPAVARDVLRLPWPLPTMPVEMDDGEPRAFVMAVVVRSLNNEL